MAESQCLQVNETISSKTFKISVYFQFRKVHINNSPRRKDLYKRNPPKINMRASIKCFVVALSRNCIIHEEIGVHNFMMHKN